MENGQVCIWGWDGQEIKLKGECGVGPATLAGETDFCHEHITGLGIPASFMLKEEAAKIAEKKVELEIWPFRN